MKVPVRRPSSVRPVVLHCTARPETPDELPARDDNGCRLLVGSTRFLRAAGERTITPHQLFTSSFLYAAPPLSRPLLRFVVHYDRVAWIAERGITLSLRLTTPHLNFFVFLSLSLSLVPPLARRFSIQSSSSAMSKPLPSFLPSFLSSSISSSAIGDGVERSTRRGGGREGATEGGRHRQQQASF